jgi:hypothetical protein
MSSITKLVAGTCAVALVGTIGTLPVYAKDTKQTDWRKKREFVYFLPKAQASATVGQRLVSCPADSTEAPSVETSIAIVSQQIADSKAMVRVDGRSGFLAKRSTKLTLNPNGTLTAFNASTEGQGGEVVSAVVKTALTIGTIAAGAPGAASAVAGASRLVVSQQLFSVTKSNREKNFLATLEKRLQESEPAASPPVLKCKPEIILLMEKLSKVDDQIASLEDLVAQGSAGTAQIALLAQRKKEQKSFHDKLTLTSKPVAFKYDKRPDTLSSLPQVIQPVEHAAWFENTSSAEAQRQLGRIAGTSGFVATIAPDEKIFAALSGDGSSLVDEARPYLFYRRPVEASIEVKPCAGAPQGPLVPTAQCTIDESSDGKQAQASKKVMYPQLSGLYSIPVGRGGIFGSRQASAKFDADGAPSELEYGAGAGGADWAKVANATNDGLVALRDREKDAWKRLAEEEASKKTYEEARKYLESLKD